MFSFELTSVLISLVSPVLHLSKSGYEPCRLPSMFFDRLLRELVVYESLLSVFEFKLLIREA